MAFIEINEYSISHNAALLKKHCDSLGVSLCAVTKCCCSPEKIVGLLRDAGIKDMADSNMENFAHLPPSLGSSMNKSLIKTRLSDINLIPDLPEYARPERVFVSDEVLLDGLSLLPRDICPDIMLIVETGDLKEGFYPEQIPEVLGKYPDLPVAGVSANYACLSGKMPDAESMALLCATASLIKTKNSLMPLVSLGGTVVYFFLKDGFSRQVHVELRSGEGIFLGHDSSSNKDLPGFLKDAFVFYGEILEIREKAGDVPESAGLNALGECSKPRKPGKRIYAVLDFGVLAAPSKDIQPIDEAAEITGQTFDFTVVDITESSMKYKTGGPMAFYPSYGAVSFAMLNRYVKHIRIPEKNTRSGENNFTH